MEERCRQYRQNFDEAVVILRAKIPPREVPGAGGAAGGVTGDGVATEAPPVAESTKKEPEEVERVEEEEEEEEILAAAAAKIKLTAEGGPYNGSVFELYLENDGEPCMLGRSTGKKVCRVVSYRTVPYRGVAWRGVASGHSDRRPDLLILGGIGRHSAHKILFR